MFGLVELEFRYYFSRIGMEGGDGSLDDHDDEAGPAELCKNYLQVQPS